MTIDTYRQDFAGYDPIAERIAQRNRHAAELRQLRAQAREFRAEIGDRKWLENSFLRGVAQDRLGVAPDKLDVAGAREWARNLMEFAESEIPHYLPCGADDAYSERQHHARSHALAIWRSVGRF
jgi:hypothetical protein